MHLKKITLNNFRCFESLELDLHPRLTVIVADNGGGKTSVLDAIAIGLSPIFRALSSANQRLEGPGFKDNDFRITASDAYKTEIKSDYTQVILESTQGFKWDNWRPSSKGQIPVTKIGQGDLNTLSAIIESYKSAPINLPVFAYYGALRGAIEIPERLRMSSRKEVNYDYPTSALFGALDAASDFKELLKWFDAEESSELRKQKDSDYPISSIALDTVRRSITTVLGDRFSDPHFDGKHKFVIRSTGDPKKLQIAQLSQGYQSMLALVMDFARRLALANRHLAESSQQSLDQVKAALDYFHTWDGQEESDTEFLEWIGRGPLLAPSIMLVDEIDLHLHPSWQQKVIGDLMRAFPFTQFIVTTHSPQVLSTVKRESIRVLTQDTEGIWSAEIPKEETKGVESSTAMNDVMGVNQVPPVAEAGWRNDYTALIENGTHESPQGTELRNKLLTLYGAQHPIILDFVRLIRFQAFKSKQAKRD